MDNDKTLDLINTYLSGNKDIITVSSTGHIPYKQIIIGELNELLDNDIIFNDIETNQKIYHKVSKLDLCVKKRKYIFGSHIDLDIPLKTLSLTARPYLFCKMCRLLLGIVKNTNFTPHRLIVYKNMEISFELTKVINNYFIENSIKLNKLDLLNTNYNIASTKYKIFVNFKNIENKNIFKGELITSKNIIEIYEKILPYFNYFIIHKKIISCCDKIDYVINNINIINNINEIVLTQYLNIITIQNL